MIQQLQEVIFSFWILHIFLCNRTNRKKNRFHLELGMLEKSNFEITAKNFNFLLADSNLLLVE